MKKYSRVFFAFAALALSLVSCSADETITNEINTQTNGNSALRSSYWSGVIGVDNGNDNYQLTVNPQQLMADLEVQLRTQGDTVSLQTIAIVSKKASNDSTTGYMLIASDNDGLSIGLMLARGANSTFKLDYGSDPDPSTITCRGCATGCNLEHLNMPGGKVPYCNSNGCGDFCQTKYAAML